MSILTMPPEILQMIFEFVAARRDLLAALTTCKTFQSEIERLVYRNIILNFNTFNLRPHRKFFPALLQRPHLCHLVQNIVIWLHRDYSLVTIVAGLSQFDNLKDLVFGSDDDLPLENANLLSHLLDTMTPKFQLSTFYDRTLSLWQHPENGANLNFNFINNQREIREIELAVDSSYQLDPSALPKLRVLSTTTGYAEPRTLHPLEVLIGNRPLTHLKIECNQDWPPPHLPRIPSLQVLSINKLLESPGQYFPQLRVLECSFAISHKVPFLKELGAMRHLTTLTLDGVPRAQSSPLGLIEEIFSHNSSLTTLELISDSGLHGFPSLYNFVSYKRGEDWEKGHWDIDVRDGDSWIER